VPIKRELAEFRVTEDALLPVGTMLMAAHFTPGQYVDIQGAPLTSTMHLCAKLHVSVG
jgi:large subunit ribosomal protein L3